MKINVMTINQLIIKMIFDRWYSLTKLVDTNIDAVSDDQLMEEIAPGKNRGIYILGHLIAINDAMLPLLDLGEQQHPELFSMFVTAPDKAMAIIPSVKELRALWKLQAPSFSAKLQAVPAEQWFRKHTAVSEEDFKKESHRNKLNVLLTRTTHLSYHVGQLALINKKQ